MSKYVAVIDGGAGDFARSVPNSVIGTFIGADKDQVVRQAIRAQETWERQSSAAVTNVILVGELTEQVRTAANYELVELS